MLGRGQRRLYGYLGGQDTRPLLSLGALNTVDEFDRSTFQWIAPTIAAAFGLSISDFGLIAVLALLVAPLVAVPVGLLADRRRRLPIVMACAAAWGLFSLLTAVSPWVWVLFIARVGAEFGRTVNYPVYLSLLADYYPREVRARALGVHAFGNTVGQVFGILLGAALADLFGWRVPFVVLAVPTFLAIAYTRHLREPVRGRYERPTEAIAPPLRGTAGRLYAVRSLRFTWFGSVWLFGGVLGATIVLPFYFDREFGVEEFGLGVIGAIGAVFGGAATLYGTRIAQRQLNRGPSQGMRWIAYVGFVIAAMLLVFAAAPNLWVAVPLLWVIIALFALVQPLVSSVTTIIAPPEMRTSAFTVGGVIQLIGVIPALLLTALADAWGTRWAMAIAAPVFVRGVFHLLTASRYVDDDVERLEPTHVDVSERTDADGRLLLLETKGLTVSYDGVQVLFGVDLQIREGEIVALLGTNGAGKSTTLNAISGLVEPDGGNIWFDGVAITGETPDRTAARGLVQAPGGRGIFPSLTVEENLRLGAFLIRKDRSLMSDRLDEVMKVFPALPPLLGLRAGALSGGQRQMLTLAQAFLLKPKLLLIDELSLGLAPVVVQELLATVRRLNAEGVTVVLVEQSVNVALTLADRAYFMEKGQVRFSGPTSDLLERDDLLRSVFFGGGTPDATLQPV